MTGKNQWWNCCTTVEVKKYHFWIQERRIEFIKIQLLSPSDWIVRLIFEREEFIGQNCMHWKGS